MGETIRVFIGSDERGGRGEIVLDHGIRKYASAPVEIIPMRPGSAYAGTKFWEEGSWNRGRSHPMPYSGQGWATNFTCFRFGIPEYCDFAGRAIYVDADQSVHADIRELYEVPLGGKAAAMRKGVMVFDNEHPFWRSPGWIPLSQMMRNHTSLGDLHGRVNLGGGFSTFPVEWDVLDGKEMDVFQAKLNHYTNMRLQPYHPFPDRFPYPLVHPKPSVDMVFWRAYGEAMAEKGGLTPAAYSKLGNQIRWTLEVEESLGLNCFGRPIDYPYAFTDWGTLRTESMRLNSQGFRGAPSDFEGSFRLLAAAPASKAPSPS